MHDSTTHAMTEVALGLSMAFFSLMILALLSFQLPKQVKGVDHLLSEAQKIKLTASQSNPKKSQTEQKGKPSEQQEHQFGFYYQGKLWDEQLNEIALDGFSMSKPVVIAVSKSEPFNKVMLLRQQINHPNLFITTLNQQWQQTLEQMQ